MKSKDSGTEQDINRLIDIVSPKKSRIRAYLGLYGIKNYVLLRNGYLEGNSPTISWYLRRLKQAGVSKNYWNVRRNLKTMAEEGIFTEKKTIRLLDNNLMTSRRVTSVEVCEFHLNENVFSALQEALKKVFRTESLSAIYSVIR